MTISDTTEAAILALIFNATAWGNYADNAASVPQTNVAAALHTADPGDSGNMSTSEIAYTGYNNNSAVLRAQVARTSGGFTVSGASPTQAALVAALSYGAGSGGSGTATHFSFGKTATVGTTNSAYLFSGTVTPNIVCGSGVTPQLTTATVCTLD
ncbi:MAG: hypothetical protein ACOVKC_08830 [Brevundimonas sp.]